MQRIVYTIPKGLADELWRWKTECKHASCKDPSCQREAHRKSSRKRLFSRTPLRRTMATQAQRMRSVKDI